MNQYLIILDTPDKNGASKRLASYWMGVHAKLADGKYVWGGEEPVIPTPYVPTEAEKRKDKIQAIKAETDAANAPLQDRMLTALLQGNDTLAAQLRDQYQANNAAMIQKIKEV